MQANTNKYFRLSADRNLSKKIRIKSANQELVAQNYFYWNQTERLSELSLNPPKPQNPYWVVAWRRFYNLLFALQKLDKLRRSQKKDFPKMGIIFVNPGEVKA